MKVKELIKILQGLPDDHEVILSSDKYGNKFSPCNETSFGKYEAVSVSSGNLYHPASIVTIKEEDTTPCVVLWPKE